MVDEIHRGEKMTTAFLSLGSNLGDRSKNIEMAIEAIQVNVGKLIQSSKLIETEPWGMDSDEWFINAVVEITTSLKPRELLKTILDIENQLGRKRTKKTRYESRVIDIDILLYGSQIVIESDLKIPHSSLPERKFNLLLLSELSPNYLHPQNNMTIQHMLSICYDETQIRSWI